MQRDEYVIPNIHNQGLSSLKKFTNETIKENSSWTTFYDASRDPRNAMKNSAPQFRKKCKKTGEITQHPMWNALTPTVIKEPDSKNWEMIIDVSEEK